MSEEWEDWPFELQDEVWIIGWPVGLPEGEHLIGRVTDMFGPGAGSRVIVKLVTGTEAFPVGEAHEFPVRMLIHPEEHQKRLI